MRKIKTIVEVKGDRARILVSAPEYAAAIKMLIADVRAGDIRARGGVEDICEDFCERHGGVLFCGNDVVVCEDGTIGVISG